MQSHRARLLQLDKCKVSSFAVKQNTLDRLMQVYRRRKSMLRLLSVLRTPQDYHTAHAVSPRRGGCCQAKPGLPLFCMLRKRMAQESAGWLQGGNFGCRHQWSTSIWYHCSTGCSTCPPVACFGLATFPTPPIDALLLQSSKLQRSLARIVWKESQNRNGLLSGLCEWFWLVQQLRVFDCLPVLRLLLSIPALVC